MDNIQNDLKKNIRLECSSEYNGEKSITKGVLKNEGDTTFVIQELKCLYKNFDGFVIEVDTMTCDFILYAGGTLPFQFPERNRPVNCYTSEVVVSKFRPE
ncbi:MAG: hypothetical protein JXA35_03765 [Deltaproteobacteria bacterium]|nr:hypothetical protein [Deltaproteobacteria bacterium]